MAADSDVGALYQPVTISASLKLQYFLQIHGNRLPLRTTVSKSIFGIGKDDVFTSGQVIYIYCLKETTVLNIVDSAARQLSIPINASVTCSPIYTSHDEDMDASSVPERVKIFRSPSDLQQALPLPKVVAIERRGLNTKFAPGEVLIVKEVTGEGLICYSINDRCLKSVLTDADSQLVFTTRPSKIKIGLKDLADHVLLPIKGLLHFEDTRIQQSFSSACQIKSCGVKKSVLASFQRPSDLTGTTGSTANDDDNQRQLGTASILNNLVEIHAVAPISLQIVEEVDEKESELMQEYTKLILDQFSPFLVQDIVLDVAATGTALQERLYSSSMTTKENWRTGVNVYVPTETVSTLLAKKTAQQIADAAAMCEKQTSSLEGTDSVENAYEDDSPVNSGGGSTPAGDDVNTPTSSRRKVSIRRIVKPLVAPKPPKNKSTTSSVNKHKQPATEGATALTDGDMIQRIEELAKEVEVLKATVLNIKARIGYTDTDDYKVMDTDTAGTMDTGAAGMTTLATGTNSKVIYEPMELVGVHDSTGSDRDTRNKELSTLTVEEVQTLLSTYHLTQYMEKFREEFIDGDLLTQLDDQMLKEELGVEQKLHRIRIMKLIKQIN